MTVTSNIAWIDSDEVEVDRLSASKLHVMHLEAIKAKLGEKWERLSGLVHQLFEKSLREAQKPSDHFVVIDELSYIVTFHSLSPEEATVACMAIAQKVCERLFGSEVDDVAVRSLVGAVPADLLRDTAQIQKINELLERCGHETIVTPMLPDTRPQETGRHEVDPHWSTIEPIRYIHSQAAAAGFALGFFPVWDLKTRRSASLYCSAFVGPQKLRQSVRRALGSASELQILDAEIAMLRGAAAYAQRVHAVRGVCAIGVGVSYGSLAGFHARAHYASVLKAVSTVPTCPLLVRIEQIPEGVPIGRLAEIVAMLTAPNLRITLEFEALWRLPQFDVRLGAAGLGGSLGGCDTNMVAAAVNRLARRAAEQQSFTFLHDIDTDESLSAVMQGGVRFGSGKILSAHHCYNGEEDLPRFPLVCGSPGAFC